MVRDCRRRFDHDAGVQLKVRERSWDERVQLLTHGRWSGLRRRPHAWFLERTELRRLSRRMRRHYERVQRGLGERDSVHVYGNRFGVRVGLPALK